MNLAPPPSDYSKLDQAQLREALRRADEQNHKRNRDVELGGGRLILTAPDGGRWQIKVSNGGLLSASAL